MNISIDEDVISELKPSGDFGEPLTIPEALICMIIKLGARPEAVIKDLLDKGVIVRDEMEADRLLIYSAYSKLIERIILQSDKTVPKVTDLDDLVIKLQELFPAERKPDKNGTPKYSYRGNKRDVAERLQKFFKIYGKYSYEDVYECTKKYVSRFKYDKTEMRLLPYFIIKTIDGQIISDLATELDNMDTEESKEANSDLNYGDMLV